MKHPHAHALCQAALHNVKKVTNYLPKPQIYHILAFMQNFLKANRFLGCSWIWKKKYWESYKKGFIFIILALKLTQDWSKSQRKFMTLLALDQGLLCDNLHIAGSEGEGYQAISCFILRSRTEWKIILIVSCVHNPPAGLLNRKATLKLHK